MRKKTVYPAHPISGDVQGNLLRIKTIVRELHLGGVVQPIAPYIADCDGILDDSVPQERATGINANTEYFRRGMIDEVWLYGTKISNGMRQEVLLAWDLCIPVVAKTAMTAKMLRDMEEHEKLVDRDIHDTIVRYVRRVQPISFDELQRWLFKHHPYKASYMGVTVALRRIAPVGNGLYGIPE